MYALDRDISEDELDKLDMNLMPGFRVEWHYNKDVGPPKHVDKVLPWKCALCGEFKRLDKLYLSGRGEHMLCCMS